MTLLPLQPDEDLTLHHTALTFRVMNSQLCRRDMIKGSVAFAALAFAARPLSTFGFPNPEDGATPIPFLDVQPKGKMLYWADLNSWITPNSELFSVQHYDKPDVDPEKWRLEIAGLVSQPNTFSLADIKARRRKTVIATLECSGNSSNPGFMGAIGNIRCTGAPLAPLLRECAPLKRGIEVVFFGADQGKEEIDKKEYQQNFARSLSISDAMRDEVLLCYEINGEPLTKDHGAPVRLVVPGWFGIAWVKWLSRIEVHDRRFMGKWMARRYVTLRGEERDDKTIWRETSVCAIDVKSVVARASRLKDGTIRFAGAAWTDGTPLQKVEVQIDGGRWINAQLDRQQRAQYAWTFWNFDWITPTPGDHTVVSRAIDAEGRVQPPADDPSIKLKRTYWEANQQWPRKLRI